jgi:hypothetical protein
MPNGGGFRAVSSPRYLKKPEDRFGVLRSPDGAYLPLVAIPWVEAERFWLWQRRFKWNFPIILGLSFPSMALQYATDLRPFTLVPEQGFYGFSGSCQKGASRG